MRQQTLEKDLKNRKSIMLKKMGGFSIFKAKPEDFDKLEKYNRSLTRAN
jgi:hypothetical protein